MKCVFQTNIHGVDDLLMEAVGELTAVFPHCLLAALAADLPQPRR